MGNKSEIDDTKHQDEEQVLEESSPTSADGVVESQSEEKPQEEEVVTPVKKPLSKTEESKAMMQSAEELIKKADQEVQEVQTQVVQNVVAFEEEKLNLINTTITKTLNLFDKLHYDHTQELPQEPFEISLGTTTEDVRVEPISTGGFAGFILGLIGFLGTAAGWFYIAAQKTGMEVDPEKLLQSPPTVQDLEPMLAWIGGGMTNGVGNPTFGIATVGLSALFVGFMFYKFYVGVKENKNYKVAKEIYERSHVYAEQQKESKSEMERIDAHIKEATPLLESFRVLLDEENGKLRRILHVEGEREDSSEYHLSSQQIMRDTDRLMDRAEKLISTPVTKDGRLNDASVEALIEAKALYESFISKLYAV